MLNILYPTKTVCHFMCEPLQASLYLVGLLLYALSFFRMCLYQAFFGHVKQNLRQKKLKTQENNQTI